MSAEIPFGGGRVILLDPQSARAGFTAAEIQDGNRRWLDRLAKIHEAWSKKRPALTLAKLPPMR